MGILGSIGGFLKKAAPIASFIPGVGPIGGAIAGIAGGLLDGGDVEGGLKSGAKGALTGLTAQQFMKAMDEANKDRARARELANQSVDLTNRATDTAYQQYDLNSPLREAYRVGALSFADPTNPFSRDLFAGQRAQLQPETALRPQMGETGAEPQGRQAIPKMDAQPKGGLVGALQGAKGRLADHRQGFLADIANRVAGSDGSIAGFFNAGRPPVMRTDPGGLGGARPMGMRDPRTMRTDPGGLGMDPDTATRALLARAARRPM